MSKHKHDQEFSLEDIMREFGSGILDEPEEAPQPPEIPAQPELTGPEQEPEIPEEDTAEELPAEEIPTEEVPGEEVPEEEVPGEEIPAESAQTVPEDAEVPPPAAPVTQDTIRIDDLAQIVGEKPEIAAPLDEPEETPEDTAEETPEEEEPDEPPLVHELPQEELPPPPIVFTPKSRLRELKKKLVAGPEKKYYDLSEIGLGRVHAAIFVSILIVVLCAGATALYAMDMVVPSRLRLMLFSQILAMLVSALLGCYVLLEGIGDLFKGRFTLNTMLFFTFLACCADAVFCLKELRVPCCAAFSLEMTFALWNRGLRRSTQISQMDTLRKAVRLDSLVKSPDYWEDKPGILRGEGQVEDFMDVYEAPTGPEKVQNLFALAALALSAGIAVLAAVLHGVSMGVQIFATSLLVAVPASAFVTLSRPAEILQRKLHMVGTVLCGWKGVKGLIGKAVFPLRDQDVFPLGAAKLNGVKFFGDQEPEKVIAFACALMRRCGGTLDPVFEQLRKSRSADALDVANFRGYESGGIGGEIQGEPVLVGTLNFLQDMGVDIPEGTMVAQAVYCSIDGQLSAVFAINYNRMRSAAAGLVGLSVCRKIAPMVLCRDFMVGEELLRSKFGIHTKRFIFPEPEVREALSAVTADPELPALALTTQEGLASSVYAISGARSLRTASRAGLAIHMAGGILGLLIMLVLAYLGSVELLTPINVLLYQLVWMIPGLLITNWTRAV